MLKKMIGALLVLLLGFSAPAPAYSEPSMIHKQLQNSLSYELVDCGYMKLIENDCIKNNLPVPKKVVAIVAKYTNSECLACISFSSYVPQETVSKIADFAADSIVRNIKNLAYDTLENYEIFIVPFELRSKKLLYDGRAVIFENGKENYYILPKEMVNDLVTPRLDWR